MFEELVKRLREKAGPFDYDGRPDIACDYEQAADAIEELSRAVDAIPHVCECCIGCEVESGGCDNAFVFSPKRAREYLNKPRWIPVTERLPTPREKVMVAYKKGVTIAQMDGYVLTPQKRMHYWRGMNGPKHTLASVTHWMPLPKSPKEEA